MLLAAKSAAVFIFGPVVPFTLHSLDCVLVLNGWTFILRITLDISPVGGQGQGSL